MGNIAKGKEHRAKRKTPNPMLFALRVFSLNQYPVPDTEHHLN